jgi:hypothetical protein
MPIECDRCHDLGVALDPRYEAIRDEPYLRDQVDNFTAHRMALAKSGCKEANYSFPCPDCTTSVVRASDCP